MSVAREDGGAAACRHFLFLQGPPGPFFRELASELGRLGAAIHRINLSGGDRYDWREGTVDYRGRMRHWPRYFDGFLQDHAITDLVLFGDCRPMHRTAVGLAQLRGVRVHVFEEGYIRPDWMTLEGDGVNGHSSLVRDPATILALAARLAPVPTLPPITAAFSRRARDSYWHYHHVVTGKLRFPFYRSHRQGSICLDGIGWSLRFIKAKRRARQAAATLEALAGRRYFLLPLQLTGDFQIRAHSPFDSMPAATEYVLDSFVRHAPADCVLLVKEHPLDSGYLDWRRWLARRARRLGAEARVLHIDGGDLLELSRAAQGMVCVNSTSGTLALEAGIPVAVLGSAVYDVAGVTFQGTLDDFWRAPGRPDRQLYAAFKRMLHALCLVRGGLASESAIRILIDSSIPRLLDPPADQALGVSPASLR